MQEGGALEDNHFQGALVSIEPVERIAFVNKLNNFEHEIFQRWKEVHGEVDAVGWIWLVELLAVETVAIIFDLSSDLVIMVGNQSVQSKWFAHHKVDSKD